MCKTLYVSNLPLSASADSLRKKFTLYGAVIAVKMLLDAAGKSRRCAFIEMQERAAADAAVAGLHLAEYDGRLMSVNRALAPASPSAR